MVTRPIRPLAHAALAAATLAAVGACGVGDKQDRADIITATPERAVAQRTAAATLTITSAPKRSTSAVQSAAPAAAARASRGGASLTTPVRFDFAGDRAEVVVTFPASAEPAEAEAPAEPTEPAEPAVAPPTGTTAIFEGERAFVQRVNRRPAERRIWAGLDFRDLQTDEAPPDQSDISDQERLYAFVTTINPRYLLDLAEGALAGSVELVGTEDVGGARTQHYRANMSIEKSTMEVDVPEEEVERRRQVFRLAGIGGDVHKAEFWIDEDGRLRRSRFVLGQRLVPRIDNRVTLTLDVTSYGEPVDVRAPAKDETVRVERYGRFVRAAIPRNG